MTSGSRLKARWRTGEDGSTSFDGWQDTMLGTPCAFRRAHDGTDRCLPAGPPDVVRVYVPSYLDPDCTHAVVPINSWCPPMYVIHDHSAINTCGEARVYKVIGMVDIVDADLLYELDPVGCSLGGVQSGMHYDLGTEIPSESFAASTVAIDP